MLCLLILGFVTRGCQASIAEGGWAVVSVNLRFFSLEHGDLCGFSWPWVGGKQAEGMSDDAEFTRELNKKY